jgi:hypothetical protein
VLALPRPAARPAARSSAWTSGPARSRRSAFREQRDSAFSRTRRQAVRGHQRASMHGRSRKAVSWALAVEESVRPAPGRASAARCFHRTARETWRLCCSSCCTIAG